MLRLVWRGPPPLIPVSARQIATWLKLVGLPGSPTKEIVKKIERAGYRIHIPGVDPPDQPAKRSSAGALELRPTSRTKETR
jgi:hypothetical protein